MIYMLFYNENGDDVAHDFYVDFTYSLLGEDIIHYCSVSVEDYWSGFDFRDIPELNGNDVIYIYDLRVYTEYTGSLYEVGVAFYNTWITDGYSDFRTDDLISYNLIYGGKYPDALHNATAFLTSAVSGFMQADLFGFGVTFGGILLVIITFSLVMWFLKVFAGG